MAMAKNFFSKKEEEEAFIKWFWTESNGNELLHKLNAYSFSEAKGYSGDFIRREKHGPFVYGLVLNLDGNLNEPLRRIRQHRGNIRLMKVGMTEVDTTPETGNRMEQIEKHIKNKFEDEGVNGKVVFSLTVNFVDTGTFFNIEKRIRTKMGFAVKKTLAEKLRLPYPTEWIFTSQNAIDELIKIKEDRKKQYKSGPRVTRVLTTEIFKSPGFTKYQDFDSRLEENARDLEKKLLDLPV